MISTFDLTLLGSLVSVGGLLFLRHGKWPALGLHGFGIGMPPRTFSAESRERHARSTALAAARWLTVGALTLFFAFAQGAEEGYLFGPWSDVMFHVVFVSACWAATAFRMNRAAEQAASVALTPSRVRQPTDN
jgi:hypothetical protein